VVEKDSFFEFSLCLSRACLGKNVHFIYKWRKNDAFRSAGRGRTAGDVAKQQSGLASAGEVAALLVGTAVERRLADG
jgi:hypothetical protein